MATVKNNVLPNKVVWIKPNFENPGWIKNPKHAAFFKLEGTYDNYVWAQDRNGKLKNLFTDEEKDFLEKELRMEPNALSVYNKQNPLKDKMIKLGKDPIKLVLSDPDDFIQLRILLTNSDKIAPSVKDIKKKATYKYYVEDEDDILEITMDKTSLTQKAWMAYGEMSKDKRKLAGFIRIYTQVKNKPITKIDSSVKLETLQAKVSNVVQNDMKNFVELVENPSYDTILLIAEGVESGEVEKKQTTYYLKGGKDKMGSTLRETIDFLNSPMNQELRLILEEKVKIAL
jgi:hypothetical protein